VDRVADLRELSVADFERRQGELFALRTAQMEVPFRLTTVNKLGDSGRAGGAFSLCFVTAPGPILQQAIYPLEHPQLGRLEIFLVPLGPREQGNLYESIFT
jgi:hypothetical protein